MPDVTSDLDVICQHARDGRIIPLQFRIQDEDGEFHSYRIKEYRDQSYRGSYTTSDGVFVSNNILVFECHIVVLNRMQTVHLYYDLSHSTWKISLNHNHLTVEN